MKIAALQEFLKDQSLAGSHQQQILQKFLLYAKLVKDPFNVFRYMEQKSIGIHFPLFWMTKAQQLADFGDYRNAFLCLKLAQQRTGVEDNDQKAKILNPKMKAQVYKEQIQQEMLRYPPNMRRTVSDYSIISNKFQQMGGTQQQKNNKMFDLLQTKFKNLKEAKEKAFNQKNQSKPVSWLFEFYENQSKQLFELTHEASKTNSSKPKQNSNKSVVKINNLQNQQRLYKSEAFNTPMKKNDPMKMVKTKDSVQMMRRKRNSEGNIHPKKNNSLASNKIQENQQFENSQSDLQIPQISMNTVPVGLKAMQKKGKKVNFSRQIETKIELPRNASRQQEEIEASRKTTVPVKGILKKKSVDKKQHKQNRQSSNGSTGKVELKLKQTQQTEI